MPWRKGRQCRKCSRQYRPPASWLFKVALLLAGVAMMAPYAARVIETRLSWYELRHETDLLTLAIVGGLLFLAGVLKIIFQRTTPPPTKEEIEQAKTMPAAPVNEQLIPIKVSSRSQKAYKVEDDDDAGKPAKAEGPPPDVWTVLRHGTVIPAHPLALDRDRKFDERRMRALTRYYLAAGAGGVAAGVHTTQFAIREHDMLRRVLETVASEVSMHERGSNARIVRVAGICGDTPAAIAEAELAVALGYDVGLLSLGALAEASDEQLIQHCQAVSKVMPIFGFYLSPTVGGRRLSYRFWRRFVEIENVRAIKIAAFNRYQTLDVMRAVAEGGRAFTRDAKDDRPIVVYTGNDDHIVGDLLGTWSFDVNGRAVQQRMVGGLLGHWACWTKAAVDMFESVRSINQNGHLPSAAAELDRHVTDMNAAIFDAAHDFKGCVPGVHEVLRRQGLLEGTWCLDPNETLSEGQAEEITRVSKAYPHLTDDTFVAEHRDEWLR